MTTISSEARLTSAEPREVVRVLVVDDVPVMAEQYAYDLRRVGGFETMVAASGDEALDVLSREPVECVVLDLEMPGVDGFEVLRLIRQRAIETPVIVYTGTGSYDRCARAVRQGALGFIDKAEHIERVVQEIEQAVSRGRMLAELKTLRHRDGAETPLIGDSLPMQALRAAIAKLASIPSGVLIIGESGTGKELVARELHRLGAGPRRPLVAVNSAALPEHLVESELFGHERGAFTGADRLRKGAFETAADGTLFLDEVGDLPGPVQAKLLRVIEERMVTRVGGDRPTPVRARIVAATNRDLEGEVEAGTFRQDLYYRLNVHLIHVPPLRERLSDLPLLVTHLLSDIATRFGVRRTVAPPEVVARLARYDWGKNNVRELRNCLERMVIAADDLTLGLDDVPDEIRDHAGDDTDLSSPGPSTLKALRSRAERRIVVEALNANEWHISHTARQLGLGDHSSLLKIMRRHDLSRSSNH
ncbi:MAG: sigma-54 dependent transcriptional regulator [Acidobacteria bacterium]|nr:sigma-54 dependent transcriptional regulator [Acidobacteriota bacterium]